MTGPPLRLVLPHQLFAEHLEAYPATVMVLLEHDLLLRQVAFHAHKLVLHRASMLRFARRLRGAGFEVVHLRSEASISSRDQLRDLLRERAPGWLSWYDPVDDWIEQDLDAAVHGAAVPGDRVEVLESPGFLTDRADLDDWFSAHRALMQDFYVWQRRRLDVLLDEDGGPSGGRWSFDPENRKKLPRDHTPPEVGIFAGHPAQRQEGTLDLPGVTVPADGPADEAAPEDGGAADVRAAIAWVSEEFPDAPGDPRLFAWPTTAEEARAHLDEFVRERLVDFGPYEDAVSASHPFVHLSLLTAPLNIGLLDPREVLRAVLEDAPEQTPLASREGFVRQLIGWREYMRALYRTQGRALRSRNHLDHTNTLGPGWWDASTGLAPVELAISRALGTGYAHHIERLMVLGNAMCLLRVHPDEVHRWFMELFIDAYDWVMVPNVHAMSQFAAGDVATTKPYVSGSNYLRTMSDLPRGDWEADWDALYWTFVDDHREVIGANPRSRVMLRALDRQDVATRRGHRERAEEILRGRRHERLLGGDAGERG